MTTNNWRKWTVPLLLLLLCLVAFAACAGDAEEPPEEDLPAEDESAEPEVIVAGLRLTDTIVEVEGVSPVLWEEFYYYLHHAGTSILQSFLVERWDDTFEEASFHREEPVSFNEYVMEFAMENILWSRAVELLFLEEGLSLPEGAESAFEEFKATQMETMGMDEAAFFVFLWENNGLTEPMFWRLSENAIMAEILFEALYGPGGENIREREAAAFAEESGILRAKHILLMTRDEEGSDLPEEEIEEIKARIDEIYLELAALTGEELIERVEELIDELGEDPGMRGNPMGYTFMPGTMVMEFEQAARDLEYGEISEPVRSLLGYHIILRLPLLSDEPVMAPAGGGGGTIRHMAASAQFEQALEEAKASLRYTETPLFARIVPGDIFA